MQIKIVIRSAKFRVRIASKKDIEAIINREIIPLIQVRDEPYKKIDIARILAVRFPAKRNTVESSVLASNQPITQHSDTVNMK